MNEQEVKEKYDEMAKYLLKWYLETYSIEERQDYILFYSPKALSFFRVPFREKGTLDFKWEEAISLRLLKNKKKENKIK